MDVLWFWHWSDKGPVLKVFFLLQKLLGGDKRIFPVDGHSHKGYGLTTLTGVPRLQSRTLMQLLASSPDQGGPSDHGLFDKRSRSLRPMVRRAHQRFDSYPRAAACHRSEAGYVEVSRLLGPQPGGGFRVKKAQPDCRASELPSQPNLC